MGDRAGVTEATDTVPRFDTGTKVIVCTQYTGAWSGGFVVARVVEEGYILGRLSDRTLLPDVFPFDDVRLERRHDPFRGTKGSYLDRRQFLVGP